VLLGKPTLNQSTWTRAALTESRSLIYQPYVTRGAHIGRII